MFVIYDEYEMNTDGEYESLGKTSFNLLDVSLINTLDKEEQYIEIVFHERSGRESIIIKESIEYIVATINRHY